jgi:hypothetical protein
MGNTHLASASVFAASSDAVSTGGASTGTAASARNPPNSASSAFFSVSMPFPFLTALETLEVRSSFFFASVSICSASVAQALLMTNQLASLPNPSAFPPPQRPRRPPGRSRFPPFPAPQPKVAPRVPVYCAPLPARRARCPPRIEAPRWPSLQARVRRPNVIRRRCPSLPLGAWMSRSTRNSSSAGLGYSFHSSAREMPRDVRTPAGL